MTRTSSYSATLLAAGRSSAVTWFAVREVKKPMAPASTAAFASAHMRAASSGVA